METFGIEDIVEKYSSVVVDTSALIVNLHGQARQNGRDRERALAQGRDLKKIIEKSPSIIAPSQVVSELCCGKKKLKDLKKKHKERRRERGKAYLEREREMNATMVYLESKLEIECSIARILRRRELSVEEPYHEPLCDIVSKIATTVAQKGTYDIGKPESNTDQEVIALAYQVALIQGKSVALLSGDMPPCMVAGNMGRFLSSLSVQERFSSTPLNGDGVAIYRRSSEGFRLWEARISPDDLKLWGESEGLFSSVASLYGLIR